MAPAFPSFPARIDILIVGAGFAGLAMAVKLRQAGMTSFLMIEKAGEAGGTWRDNHYPGAACDIPSHLYSLSFEPEAGWSRMYPGHAELQAYLTGIKKKHDLRSRICFDTSFREARYDEQACLWEVGVSHGAGGNGTITARVVICAIGALHEPAIPHLPGIECFAGETFHSSAWNHDYDLRGKRAAVIGTGASAIQFVPHIAPVAAQLSIFQRTAPWITPKQDYPISARRRWLMKHLPLYRRLFRWRLFWSLEIRVLGFLGNAGMITMGERIANSYRERKIRDPGLRAKLTPDYRLGCKRVLLSNDYYQTLLRDNTALVTQRITEVQPGGIATSDGQFHPADVIIYGTGFKATDLARYGQITGVNGVTLAEAWAKNGAVFWGIATPGFPNYFVLLGPNTGLGHNSVILMIEAQVRYVMSALKQMKRRGIQAIDVKPEALAHFAHMLDERMARTIWQSGGCKSWYQNEQGRNTTMWPGSVVEYIRRTRTASLNDFHLTPERAIHG